MKWQRKIRGESDRGFSLLEVLISAALGLLIINGFNSNAVVSQRSLTTVNRELDISALRLAILDQVDCARTVAPVPVVGGVPNCGAGMELPLLRSDGSVMNPANRVGRMWTVKATCRNRAILVGASLPNQTTPADPWAQDIFRGVTALCQKQLSPGASTEEADFDCLTATVSRNGLVVNPSSYTSYVRRYTDSQDQWGFACGPPFARMGCNSTSPATFGGSGRNYDVQIGLDNNGCRGFQKQWDLNAQITGSCCRSSAKAR